jgi:hypothetical protein
MPKNIVLCCDGTANEFAQDRTNVVKLYFALHADPTRQVTYYHPGLGTMEPPGALAGVTRLITRFAGRAFGYGTAFFGIWDRQNAATPVERFPRSDDGWAQAWRRYTQIENNFTEVH